MKRLQLIIDLLWALGVKIRNTFGESVEREAKRRFCNFTNGGGCRALTRHHAVIREIDSNTLVCEAYFCSEHHPARNARVHALFRSRGHYASEITLHFEP